mgnify:CR=1 FL=1
MPMCGFNKQMVEGLSGFHNGLVEHGILDRSKKKDQSTKQTIDKELQDMEAFLKETHRIQNPEIRDLTESLARYASSFYKIVKKNGVNNYKEIIQFLSKFYFNMDNKYYSELEGKPEAMKELALYLNTLKFKEEH